MGKTIFELRKELNDLLKEHPELIPLQEEINRRLSGAGNRNNRLVIIQQMMRSKAAELAKASEDLKDALHNLLNSLNSIKIE